MNKRAIGIVALVACLCALRGWGGELKLDYEAVDTASAAGNVWVSLAVDGQGRLGVGYDTSGETKCWEREADGTWGPRTNAAVWPAGSWQRRGDIFYNVGTYAGLPGLVSRDYYRTVWGVNAGVVETATARDQDGHLAWAEVTALVTNFDVGWSTEGTSAEVGGVPTAFAAWAGGTNGAWLYSSTNGVDWTGERVDEAAQKPCDLRVDANASGVSVAFKKDSASKLYLRNKSSTGSWDLESEQVGVSGTSHDIGGFGVARYSNTVYVAYLWRSVKRGAGDEDGETQVHLVTIDPSGSTTETVARIENTWGTVAYTGCDGLRLDVDEHGNAYMAYRTFHEANMSSSTNDSLVLARKVGGRWKTQIVDDDCAPSYMDLVVETGDRGHTVFIAWRDPSGTDQDPWIEGETDDQGLYLAEGSVESLTMMEVPAADGGGVTADFWISCGEISVDDYLSFLNDAESNGLVTIESGEIRKATGGVLYASTTDAESSSPIVYAVTNDLGSRFSSVEGRLSHPMIDVSWYGAAAFCNWLSAVDGLDAVYDETAWSSVPTNSGYRLPTEAEWRKAAAWDPDRGVYHAYGQASTTVSSDEANYWDSGDAYETGEVQTCPVLSYSASSPYGLYDVMGNAWEWSHDLYNPYSTNVLSGARALRGGSWGNLAEQLKTGNRIENAPDAVRNTVGFRVATSVDPHL